jgi:hypothetical protein
LRVMALCYWQFERHRDRAQEYEIRLRTTEREVAEWDEVISQREEDRIKSLPFLQKIKLIIFGRE